MADIPDNVDLNWIARRLQAPHEDMRALGADMDMLTRLVVRMDHTLDAVREAFAMGQPGRPEAAHRK